MSKKFISILLALVMVLSLVAPVIPAAATEVQETSEKGESDLRIGVLSDIHVSYDYTDEVYGNVSGYFNGVQPSRFEKALRFFKAQGVEAVVIAGDLQEASGTDAASLDKQKDWLQKVVDIWFEVFPEQKGEEGYVEPIFTYGNHDSALVSARYWPEELGTYEDAFLKEVNGYTFVCTHNAKEEFGKPLLESVAASNQDKPIFYIQHCPIYNTVPGSTGGYGVGYGQVGRKTIAPYHNVIALNGHTHVPLTDERSIWQGDEGNEGQFTVLNTATINYSGLSNDEMSVNSYTGNAQQTEHGMIIDVVGSELSVDRYSFNNMVFDEDGNTWTGEADKIGETWSWDACDISDRPYAYDSRVENAVVPEFPADAAITVSSVTDTAVTVTVPAASITPAAGFSDLIEGYVVEACNPTSGEVEATGRIATAYHIDDENVRFADSYTVTVSGLKPGTLYTLNVYAQEFYDQRSLPLTSSVTTTGELTSYRTGDVNQDGLIDEEDMNALKLQLESSKKNTYNPVADIDGNRILESRDIVELQAILDAGRVTYPESEDLMDLVSTVSLTGASTSTNYQPVDYGTVIQNSVVRGDSNQAVKTWTTNYAYYPNTTMYFSEPVDLSGYTHLSFDTLFENEYSVSESYRKRWLSVSLISGNQEQIASYGSMNFDPNGDGWTTKTISLAALTNIDLTAVTGIRFSHNFDYYEGRYDGVNEHAIYWDNFHGLVIEGADADMLYNSGISGGSAIYGAGYTKNSNHAVLSTGGTLDVTFQSEKTLSNFAGFEVYVRTPSVTTVNVQPYDAEGNLLGNAISVDSCRIYTKAYLSVADMGVAEGVSAAGLRFTYSVDSLLLDTMSIKGSKDYDLIGSASSINFLGGSNCNAMLTTEGTNGSNNALYASAAPGTAVWTAGGELIYDTPLDLSQTPYLRLDIKVQNAHWAYGVVLYNSDGEVIWRTTHYNATSSGGKYATYEFDLRSYRTYEDGVGYVNHEISLEALKDVAKIVLTNDLASTPNWTTDNTTALREVWFDNLVACNPLEDFMGAATSLQAPSAVQEGFICEIMPSTSDGHTNVLHWYSDSSKNSGTTSNWPGSTIVTISKDVLFQNHSGYTNSYDYLEFDIKTTGVYIAIYLTLKDSDGATICSSGEYRISYEMDWTTFRLDAAKLGITNADFNRIATIEIGWNWQHQNANGTAAQYAADIYIDNMGLRTMDAESDDYLDQITLVNNADWWTGGNGKFTGGGWKFQSDVTADSEKALMFYRSETSQNVSYGSKTLYMYFNAPITVESDWTISLDAIKHNYNASGAKVQLIGSDDAKYDLFSFTHTGTQVENYQTEVSAISGFDPATTTIKGLYFTYPMNPDSSMDKAAFGYLVLDNLLIQDPSDIEEPTEPPTEEPTEPEDPNDLLGNTDVIQYQKTHWDNYDGSETGLTALTDTENVFGDTSTRSWSFNAIAAASNANAIAQLHFGESIDMTGCYLVFDAKFLSEDSAANLTFQTRLHDTDYVDVTTNVSTTIAAGDWRTVVLNFSNSLVPGKDLTDVSLVTFTMDYASNTGYARSFYVDNMRLVKLESLDDDMIHCKVDTGSTGNLYWLSDSYTYGDSSVSIRLQNTSTGINDIYYNSESQYGSSNLPNFKNKIVSAHFYFGDQSPYATLQLVDKSWSGVIASPFCFEDLGDGWYLGMVNTSTITTHAATTDISKCIRFSVNTNAGSVVYMDNFQVTDGEAGNEDWINISLDTGATKGAYGPNTTYTYGEDSIVSLRFEPTGGGYISFHTQNEVSRNNGAWDAYPDMTDGTLSAYIYFGDQTPSVKVQLTDISWKNSTNTAMQLEDVGNGWYRATADLSAITKPDGFDATQVIRIYLTFTAGQVVYIDQMELIPTPNPLDDMISGYTSFKSPTAVQENFVCEILDETADGHTDVVHLASSLDNGQPTSNWPGTTKVYIGSIPSNVDASEYDFVEWKYKQTGIAQAFYLSFYDAAGNNLGGTGGVYASRGCGWVTHRAKLSDIGLTADEILQIAMFDISVSWDYNSTVGSFAQSNKAQVGEFFVDDVCFGCVEDSSVDLFDHVVKTNINAAATVYTGSDMYFDDNGAHVITREPSASGWKDFRLYFDNAITVDSDWMLSCDFEINNFHHGGSISLIGSDGKLYSSIGPNKAGTNTVTKAITSFASSGTAFDPATVQIVGISYSYSLGTSNAVTDTTVGGYMKLDNLILTDPTPEEATEAAS